MRQRRRSFSAGSRGNARVRLCTPASTLISLTCLTLAPQLAEEAGAQVIRGVVVDSASQLPLNGVLVLLTDSAQREVQRYMVDSNGEFEFSGLDVGWYSVRAERMGMAADTRERVEVASGDTVSLKLALRELSIADLVQQVGQVVDLSADRTPPEGAVDEGGGAPGAGGQIAFREDGGVIVGQVAEGDDAARESGG
ncbi:MAG: carboxypeptidase regulatory-like domain-containing protein, partial [Gemmatimonadetes bacterium]|nr:carboxypeptidase regulatory-like domain-containing protein [Gemmatimonadota bacterium]